MVISLSCPVPARFHPATSRASTVLRAALFVIIAAASSGQILIRFQIANHDDGVSPRFVSSPYVRKDLAWIECSEFVGKVVSSFRLYEDTIDGPEISIEFTDGTVFSSCLKTSTALEAKMMRNEAGHPRLIKDYSTPPVAR